MLDLIPAHPAHVAIMRPQSTQVETGDIAPVGAMMRMCAKGRAFAAVDRERNYIAAIAGLEEIWPGRSLLWSVLDRDCKPYMRSLVALTRRALAHFDETRVEAYVLDGFDQGARLMRALGFEREGFMPRFMNDLDYWMWARVKER